jgi:hypothetical protein
LAVHGVNWTIEWVDKTAGTFNLERDAPASSATYYFTAKKLDTTEWKSRNFPLDVTTNPDTPARNPAVAAATRDSPDY